MEVLVSTMNQQGYELIERMRLDSDAVIINQCGHYGYEETERNGHAIRIFHCAERGVGLSRNLALMRAKAEICLFADDDVSYADDYAGVIEEEFKTHPEADVIAFNVPSTNPDPRMRDYIARKWRRLTILNCFRHGTFRLAVRREAILKKNICFTLLFGGGCRYSAGEDSLFLADCIRRGLRVFESEKTIGSVSHAQSTWFHGYTDQYFRDKGAFFACFSKHIPFLWCLQFAVRRHGLYSREKTFLQSCRCMKAGIREFRKRGT